MTISDFLNKWNGKPLDFDGYYGYQCMDLYQYYNRDVIGAPYIPADPAYKVWTLNQYPKDFYTKIANTPTNVPQKGDVVIWSAQANGGFGHIAIFYQGDMLKFTSFDQNWNGKYAHFQPHNYSYVLGWLRPKKPVTTQPVTLEMVKQIVFSNVTADSILNQLKKLLS